jgi:hypothetical protein
MPLLVRRLTLLLLLCEALPLLHSLYLLLLLLLLRGVATHSSSGEACRATRAS